MVIIKKLYYDTRPTKYQDKYTNTQQVFYVFFKRLPQNQVTNDSHRTFLGEKTVGDRKSSHIPAKRRHRMQCPGQNEGRSVTCSRPVNSMVVCMHQHAQASIGKDCREYASKQDSAPTEQTTGMRYSIYLISYVSFKLEGRETTKRSI